MFLALVVHQFVLYRSALTWFRTRIRLLASVRAHVCEERVAGCLLLAESVARPPETDVWLSPCSYMHCTDVSHGFHVRSSSSDTARRGI